MYRSKRIIFGLAILYTLSGYSQLQPPNSNSTLQDLAFFIDVNNKKYANAQGSKYIYADFKLAKIEGLSGSHLVRFDPVDNIIQLKKEDNKILSLSKKYQYKIELLDGTGIYETQQFINTDGKIENTFFESIHTSKKYKLYKKHRIKFQPAKPAKSSYEPATDPEFIPLDAIYYVMNLEKNPGHLLELPRKKKVFLNFFGNRAKEMSKYIKTQNLKTSSEQDLIKILNYYFQ
ncbi:hypothetical protein ACFSQJ_03010 [Croceitalea marina]|uniref:DUF4369 domain-containing protein n=1 Tax=Croceitalea marina TaxID=1775166 RepID=A0ABW5MRW0_9FLAO